MAGGTGNLSDCRGLFGGSLPRGEDSYNHLINWLADARTVPHPSGGLTSGMSAIPTVVDFLLTFSRLLVKLELWPLHRYPGPTISVVVNAPYIRCV